jgi:SAM-dependent methyltransferase
VTARPLGTGFDRVARIYAPLERVTFGRALTACRDAFIPRLEDVRRALVLGDGDGRFTEALLLHHPHIEVTAIDGSAAMLALLDARVRRVAPEARVALHHADARAFIPEPPAYDLVVSHFFLDCLSTEDVAALVARLVPGLRSDARWIVSEFATPRGLLRWPAWALVRVLYLAFRLLTGLRVTRLPDHATPLARHGFQLAGTALRLGGVLRAELWQRAERSARPLGRIVCAAPSAELRV